MTTVPTEAARPGFDDTADPLQFHSVKALRNRVQAAGPRHYLLRGYWPGGDYGVHAGDPKAQKTWTTVDAAVSVASGTAWLGLVPVDMPGPVLMFMGEGGEADILRRVDAVAASRGLDADDLPITVCCRAPHLDDVVHRGLMADQLDLVRPVLTIVDPLYLAARKASAGDLYGTGELLEYGQHLCQAAGSALWVAHHQNRRDGRGLSRISGAGPAEWGRVLITAVVKARKKDPATQETNVTTELDAIGGSIADGGLRVVRKIRADDPDDLNSPLYYSVQAYERETDDENPEAKTTARIKVQQALWTLRRCTVKELGDVIMKRFDRPLTRETISRNLTQLEADGLAVKIDNGNGKAAEWEPVI